MKLSSTKTVRPFAGRLLSSAMTLVIVAGTTTSTVAQSERLVNQWVDAGVKYELPANVSDAKWVTGDGYCGSVYRSKTGGILIRTGIRSKLHKLSPGFYSNTTLEWNLNDNTARAIETARWSGGSYGGGALHEGFDKHPTPSPRHTYDGVAYVESEDTLYLMLGAYWRTIGRNHTEEAKQQLNLDHGSTWKYSFADKRWASIDHNVNTFWKISPYETHLRYWPQGGRLMFFNDRGSRYAEFDLKTQKWNAVEIPEKSPVSLYNARSAWDSKRQLWVFRLGPELCTFDPSTRRFTRLPLAYPIPEDSKAPTRRWKGIVYIPKHDAYLITGPTGNDTRVFHVANRKWFQLKAGDLELPNGYPQYDPKTDQVVLVYQLKAFRLAYRPLID